MSVMDDVLSSGLLASRDKKALVARVKELFEAVDIPEDTQKKSLRRFRAVKRSVWELSARLSIRLKSCSPTNRQAR